jgi:hypothetical protein
MPWYPASGCTLEYPTALHAKIARSDGKVSRDDALSFLNETQRIYREAINMDVIIRELQAENLRLKYENEFMLRLINERDA